MQDGEILACDTPEKLKKMADRNIFSCNSRYINATCRLINEETDFSSQIYGDQMRIFTPTGAEDLSLLKTLLSKNAKNNGLDIYDVKKVSPNIDDVYMEILARETDTYRSEA